MTEQSILGKLDEILKQVESSKRELEESVDNKIERLSTDFAHASNEIQRIKEEKDFQWKRDGNKLQHNFNAEVLEGLGQIKWALQYQKVDYANELLEAEIQRLNQRNKLIKIADSSEGGWETVTQYVANELADNSEDDKKISRADGRAVKKMKARQRGRSSRFTPMRRPYTLPTATYTRDATSYAAGSLGRNKPDQPFRVAAAQSIPRSGACLHCGDFTHWKRSCPYLNVHPQQPRGGAGPASAGQ